MSLTTAENGDVTLSKDRHDLCMSAVWEMEALAYLLPTVTSNTDEDAFQSGLVARGIASRFVGLSNALMAALCDGAEKNKDIAREVYVLPISGRD